MTQVSLAPFLLHSRDEFQTWLARDLEVREDLYALMGSEPTPDVASLDEIEQFLLTRYPDPPTAVTLAARAVTDAVARHIGLVMILNIDDAVWEINLDDADRLFYRLPIIRFADDVEACPVALATASLDRRTGQFLRTVIENYQDTYN
jgi:hypothetical protein